MEFPLGFDNMLLHKLYMKWNVFQDFNITNSSNLIIFLIFFRHQVPCNLLQELISCCLVSRVNGMVINFFMTPVLVIFR